MQKVLFLIVTLFCSFFTFCQDYWQQEVNFKIEVTLNDVNHTLQGNESFEYINNSPNTLDFIYVHLWPNAYRSEKTALGKQLWEMGETLLKFGDDSLKGNIDGLDFKIDGETVRWEYDPEHIDICKLILNKPLATGSKMLVSTPFTVKIPSGEISRLGHVGQSYQITQWYPKPAVYDKNGWNQIPYLTQGEFYSEFGSFDVSITLPENYVVGATGDLQTESEVAFLKQKLEETSEKLKEVVNWKKEGDMSFPASSSKMKTIRYTQSKIHDFAWFADKRYFVLQGEVELPASKEKVTSWAMFTPKNAELWKKSIEYLNDAIHYYSLWNGDYPYKQVTAVDGTISAGGGMEYPNVTVIGNASSANELEVVIVHEVGHNWFYGILGSNERVHGWMDEGMNTLNEVRYMQTKYPDNTAMSDMVLNGKFHMDHLSHHDMSDVAYRLTAVLGEDQPIETHSAEFTSANYGSIMYMKTGLVMFYLKDYLGDELFGEAMHAYYEKWKFKHPQPEDMREVVEAVTGKDLAWLFEDLIQTTNHIDYKIQKVKKMETGFDVTVKNVGQVNGPIEVSSLKNGKVVETVWLEPGECKRVAHLESDLFDEVRIDVGNDIPEIDRTNNSWKRSLLFNRIEPITYEFLFGDHEVGKSNNFWTPIIAGNKHDGLMLGLVSHNYGIPFNRFQYLVAPMFGFRSKQPVGVGEFAYSFLPKKTIQLARLGLSIKSFSDGALFNGNYLNASPYLLFKIGNRKKASPISQTLLLQGSVTKSSNELDIETGGFARYRLNYITKDLDLKTTIRNDFMQNLTDNSATGRLSIEGVYRFRYLKNKMKRWIELRGYYGNSYFNNASLIYQERFSMGVAGGTGYQDFFYEEYYLSRGNTDVYAQQRSENFGNLKTGGVSASTNEWMTAGNLYFQLPFKPGIFGIYSDIVTFQKYGKVNTYIDGGLAIRLGKVMGIYFPLIANSTLTDVLPTKYGERIRFSLKMNIVNTGFSLSNLM
jgi:hypothetical protein